MNHLKSCLEPPRVCQTLTYRINFEQPGVALETLSYLSLLNFSTYFLKATLAFALGSPAVPIWAVLYQTLAHPALTVWHAPSPWVCLKLPFNLQTFALTPPLLNMEFCLPLSPITVPFPSLWLCLLPCTFSLSRLHSKATLLNQTEL